MTSIRDNAAVDVIRKTIYQQTLIIVCTRFGQGGSVIIPHSRVTCLACSSADHHDTSTHNNPLPSLVLHAFAWSHLYVHDINFHDDSKAANHFFSSSSPNN
eukprot:m.17597 g.17597  ORF g.17597 m.17597 type:complete len:101 (+) comp7513_c0_seq1:3284-3586(+)